MAGTCRAVIVSVVFLCLGPSGRASAQGARSGQHNVPPDLRVAVAAALAPAEYDVTSQPEAPPADPRWVASNPKHDLRAMFSAQAVCVGALNEPTAPSLLTLQLVAWGREGSLQAPLPAKVVVMGARIESRRGPLVEWYVNEPHGLEQGFTIEEAPPTGNRDMTLVLQLALGGRLRAELAPDGRSLALRDEQGMTVLSYAQLAAWDAEGRPLFAWMELSNGMISIMVDEADAIWPITVDPLIANEQAKLTASDAATDDKFGISVALSGDTAVIGAWGDDTQAGVDAGAAYVFVRSGTSWIQQAKLTASDAAAYDVFGYSVAVSGETAVVGALGDSHAGGTVAGSAYVFVRSGTSWIQQAKLTASDAAASDNFGNSVALEGDTALVGTVWDDNAGGLDSGSAYVFVRSGTSWTQQAKLIASDAATNDLFGTSVALSGNTAVVGAREDNHSGGTDAGSAYVFVRSGTSWTQQAKLTASDAATDDWFGVSVALSGDTAVVGTIGDDHSGGTNAASAYVFARSGTSWSEQAKLTASDAATDDGFGCSVALLGDTAVVGARGDSHAGGAIAGSAYVFVRSGTSWTQQAKITASDAAQYDVFGESVALSDDTAVVGADYDDHATVTNAGAAYVFTLDPDSGDPPGLCVPTTWEYLPADFSFDYSQAVTFADVTSDGRSDLVAASSFLPTSSGELGVFVKQPNGTFVLDAQVLPLGSDPQGIAGGDQDNDGHIDIATANFYSGDISVWRGTGSGLGSATTIFLGATAIPSDVALGDMDGDGDDDIVCSDIDADGVAVVKSLGPLSFSSAVFTPTTLEPRGVALGDVDADGTLDVAVNHYASGTVRILANVSGTGSLTPQATLPHGPSYDIDMADFDGDGDLDVVTPRWSFDTIEVSLRDGATYAAKVSSATIHYPGDVDCGDFDANGLLDVVVSSSQGKMIGIMTGTGAGGFSLSWSGSLAGSVKPMDVAVGDSDADGFPEIAVAVGQVAYSDDCEDVSGNNLPPLAIDLPTPEELTTVAGSTLQFSAVFSAPEPEQIVTLSVNDGGLLGFEWSSTAASMAVLNCSFEPGLAQIGEFPITITAIDNGVPALQTATNLELRVLGSSGSALCVNPQGDLGSFKYSSGLPLPSDKVVEVSNCGFGSSVLSWATEADGDLSWLAVEPSGGQLQGSESVAVNLSVAGVPPGGSGTYSGKLRFVNTTTGLFEKELALSLMVTIPGDVVITCKP